MRQMITPDQARQIVLENIAVLPAQTVNHAQALGRVLAEDIFSEIELPPFDNSAMDGYAVIAADLEGADEATPVGLQLLETIGAGAVGSQTVQRGTCIKIMTGAPLPAGADAVVMREETREENGSVQFLAPARAGQNIRPRGDDVKIGEKVLERGTLIGPAQWAMLASLGKAQVEVFRAPSVGIITTGEELVDVDAPLQPGQIRDSNSFALEGLCREVGASVERIRIGDGVAAARETIEEFATRFDCLITSGGVSAGDFDPIRDALLQLQKTGRAQIHFWKIAMKPGKPVMFGTLLGDGRWEMGDGECLTSGNASAQADTNNDDLQPQSPGTDTQALGSSKPNPPPTSHLPPPIFGLPGNPVSVMVAFEQFVRPALLRMQGQQEKRITVEARVLTPFKSPPGKVEFVRVHLTQNDNEWLADVTGGQGSGRLSTMTRANALLIVPAEVTQVETGQKLPATMMTI